MPTGIEAIGAVTAATSGPAFIAPANETSVPSGAFASLMTNAIGTMNADVTAAESTMRSFAAGGQVELHEVMIGLEQARIGVQTFIQIRNKLIESYQDVMRMQM